MRYRATWSFESVIWAMLNALTWIGVIGVAWSLFRPGGWLYRGIGLVLDNRPTSYYYVAAVALGLLLGKRLLDRVHPDFVSNLLTAIWAFAGTFFIVHLLPL